MSELESLAQWYDSNAREAYRARCFLDTWHRVGDRLCELSRTTRDRAPTPLDGYDLPRPRWQTREPLDPNAV